MKNVKRFLAAGLTLAAFGTVASAANGETALPSVLLLPGVEEVEVRGESATQEIKFFGVLNLQGAGWLIALFGKNMAELGLAKLLYTNIIIESKKCNTAGDGPGLVLIDNAEWHLALGLSGGAGLFLITILLPAAGVLILCEGGTNIVVKGSRIMDMLSFGVEVAKGGELKGATGKCNGTIPAFTEWDNMSGTMSKVELKSELDGTGLPSRSCLEIAKGEQVVGLKASQAIEIMEP
ncbi:MAG TPA: hypothetical protein VN618_04880 [Solirubrobacteraceae bacterium]|nr:hypothetical protein [Solirubrobacteraceae bacterium]